MDQPADQAPPPLPPLAAAPPGPPPLPGPPALPQPPARPSTKLPMPVVVAVCLAVALAAGVVSNAVVGRMLSRPPGAATGTGFPLDGSGPPDELMRMGNAKGGLTFRRQLARAAERATKRTVPNTLITFDEAVVIDDLGTMVRGSIGYRGRTTQAIDEGVHVDGKQRHYFHSRGAVIVDVVCVTSVSDCVSRDVLLETTEEKILGALNEPGIDVLLPEHGRCEYEYNPAAGRLATCQFDEEGVVLSIQKLSLDENHRMMKGLARPKTPGL